jgi:hypothetical protein
MADSGGLSANNAAAAAHDDDDTNSAPFPDTVRIYLPLFPPLHAR